MSGSNARAKRSGRLAGVWLAFFVAAALSAARAQDDPCDGAWQERAIEIVGGQATQTALALDVSNNAYLASVVGGRIVVHVISPRDTFEVPIVHPEEGVQADPSFATNGLGVTFLAYSHLGADEPHIGRDIILARNGGNGFQFLRNVSDNRLDDYAAQLALGGSGEPHLVWAQRVGDSTRVLYWTEAIETSSVVATEGNYPSLAIDRDQRIHVAFSRGNDVVYSSGDGNEFSTPVPVTQSLLIPESSVSVAVDRDGAVLIAYESHHSLYVSVAADGRRFAPPRLLDAGGVLDPLLRLKRDDRVVIGYAKNGDFYSILGNSASFDPPIRLQESSAVESFPSLDLDLNGSLHGGYIRDSVVYYGNNACAPTIDFTATPTTGRVPLEVSFTDLSSGGIERWEWDFGDGNRSGLKNPVHTYNDTGVFDVTLRAYGAGGVVSERTIEGLIAVQNPLHSMRIPDQQVLPGAEDVWFPVIATSVDKIQGFQTAATYDPNFLTLNGYNFSLTALETNRIDPDFVQLNDFGTYLEFGTIFETQQPFEDLKLPPIREQRLVHFVFDVPNGAPQGETTRVELINNAKITRIFNIFIVDGRNRIPAIKGANVKVRVVEPPFPSRFVRGDFNSDGTVNVADGIGILNYLFQGTVDPECFDGADSDDSGRVDITDAILLLNFLFVGTAPPSVPYPNDGLDPTEDELGECF